MTLHKFTLGMLIATINGTWMLVAAAGLATAFFATLLIDHLRRRRRAARWEARGHGSHDNQKHR
ncbi:hypothetical protein GC207_02570 [bacterium]|nr:hypothetical protein [bacterium]